MTSQRARYVTSALTALALGGFVAPCLGQPAGEPPAAAIWFEELAGAEPLPESAAVELARHLAAISLRPAATSEAPALPPSLAADREPRMLFLSLSDGASARVLRAAGRGAGEAVARLGEELRGLRGGGFEPRYVKVDLVREVHRRQKVDPDRRLQLDRSLFGLAFERDVGLAFLAEEVVAHTLINSDQELRLPNVRKRPRAASVGQWLEVLARAETLTLYRFSAASYFADGSVSQGGEVVPLFRGHRGFADPDPEELLHHARLAGEYLTRAVEDSGRFVYSYLPKTDKTKSEYNALRHAGTAYSMLELYEVTGGDVLLKAAERALGYLERELVRPCRVGEIEAACVLDKGNVKLGGNALAIVALAKHAAVTGGRGWRPKEGHRPLIDSLGRWILAVQAEDGEFKIHKQAHPGGKVSSFVSQYYPGEALLALARRPEPDPAWVGGAARGARWLIEVRDRDLPVEALNHDHWLLYALSDIHRLKPNPLYLEHASRITRAILSRQRRASPGNPDWVGSYYTPPRSTPTATRSEGLGAAYFLLRDAGREREAAEILAALERGVRFQLQTQLLPENVLYLPDPARALGGFRRSLTNYEIRIDYVQHNISALLLLRRILLEDAAAAAG